MQVSVSVSVLAVEINVKLKFDSILDSALDSTFDSMASLIWIRLGTRRLIRWLLWFGFDLGLDV